MFVNTASESNHRRSGRCTTFVCSKCGDTFKDKNVKLDHIKMCDMFQPVDESVLAEVVVDVNSDTVTLTDTVTLADMDIDINDIEFETTPTFYKI